MLKVPNYQATYTECYELRNFPNIFAREIHNFATPVFNFVGLKNYYVMK